MAHENYENPLVTRYASREMSSVWSAQTKFQTWRKLWVMLAEAQHEMGLAVTQQQVEQLRANVANIDFEAARGYEKRLRHDVMAHVHAYGDVCPDARGIIHLGATSCYITDNTDLILLRQSLQLIRSRIVSVLESLAGFARAQRDLPCLGYTHFQPAQPTTVGKRACLWAYDLVLDLAEIEHRLASLAARSVKGTTGTQASFLDLFAGDHGKVQELEVRVANKIGFETSYAVSGQTYSRKVDSQIVDALSGVAQSAHKMATDLRLLANRKEVEEPFEKEQIGSSAMAYKRNPMRSERICSLARYAISLQSNTANTMATQWMERTLDDSANRRIVLPQAFLAVDAVLVLYRNVTQGLVVYPRVIENNLLQELPFMATENILMQAVAQGGDRQTLHEAIRQHSHAAGAVVKQEGKPNDLLDRLAADSAFAKVDIQAVTDPSLFVGRAPEQVDEFLAGTVQPILDRLGEDQAADVEIQV